MVISSSAIKEVAYLETVQTPFVVWRQGKVAMYRDVPVSVWEELSEASSKGTYFWDNIREKYDWAYV